MKLEMLKEEGPIRDIMIRAIVGMNMSVPFDLLPDELQKEALALVDRHVAMWEANQKDWQALVAKVPADVRAKAEQAHKEAMANMTAQAIGDECDCPACQDRRAQQPAVEKQAN